MASRAREPNALASSRCSTAQRMSHLKWSTEGSAHLWPWGPCSPTSRSPSMRKGSEYRHELGGATPVRSDHRQAHGHGLNMRPAPTLAPRGKDESVGSGVETGQVSQRQSSDTSEYRAKGFLASEPISITYSSTWLSKSASLWKAWVFMMSVTASSAENSEKKARSSTSQPFRLSHLKTERNLYGAPSAGAGGRCFDGSNMAVSTASGITTTSSILLRRETPGLWQAVRLVHRAADRKTGPPRWAGLNPAPTEGAILMPDVRSGVADGHFPAGARRRTRSRQAPEQLLRASCQPLLEGHVLLLCELPDAKPRPAPCASGFRSSAVFGIE
eukprot:CAMPEP_0177281700 /NCGR_PEP_ID=MMETSP0367-20130122/71056_1 /TAXON_ID=447022 ORGANISM="Scrippsiella hangoei-like, Strain SHHI-4" /NCGR_SAMPLE_ID=MMETSP0367 /ASSEMBLY_ACC=CAM_ASM_000362 /LENGTH=328 /DNA_ID=CAMNT_0018738551 /DNA_START=25 /DNA_END=1008 /DNA_ORIENTATION=+